MPKYVVASWPGVESVEGLSCTHSLGISPSSIQLMIHPQDRVPAESGNLVFGDGDEQVTLRDCKLDRIRSSTSGEGKTWTLDILDRRWKWQFGSIYGWYNQLDRHAKLIPWTIRSPRELAILCLQAMGETNYDIDMPTGLARADGENHGLLNPPWLGVAATTGTNPPVHWNGEPPALALDRLCQQFGRIVVWQWKSNRVLITRPGIGKALPDGSLYQESPSFDSPETPTGGAIHGAPTKYQVRLALEAVGEEWDGSYWPIDQLSYAPLAPGAVQIIRVRCYPFAGDRFQIILNSPDPTNPRAGAVFEVTAPASPTATGVLTSFKNAINVQGLNNRIDGVITASMDGDQLVLTGLRMGDAWSCHVSVYRNAGTDGRIHQRLVQAAVRQTASWRFSFPKEYPGVRATDRLTLSEARALAQKSVWRCYRLSALDPNGRPIRIPGYPLSPLRRRQQIVLTDTQVEQVVPEQRLANLQERNGQPFTVNFYNGYSRDKPAAVYGSIARYLQGVIWSDTDQASINTPVDRQVFIPFSVDDVEQIITFSGPVYKYIQESLAGGIEPANILLQTGVHIRNAETNALEVFALGKLFPGMKGTTNFVVRKAEEVQLNIIGRYNNRNEMTGGRDLDGDARNRADYLLKGLELQYIPQAAQTRGYNGIRAIELDGAVSQISWSIGAQGMSTTASVGTEHSIWIPPLPARRRAEFLPPVQQQAIENVVARRRDNFDQRWRGGGIT